jgi:hypothetical protein
MGRWGSTEDDEADYVYVRPRPRQSTPRVRIKTDDETIPQRKPREEERRTATSTEHQGDPKALIKQLVLDHPDMPVREIAERVGRSGQSASLVAVSNIRAEFKHSLKFLTERGLIRRRQRES